MFCILRCAASWKSVYRFRLGWNLIFVILKIWKLQTFYMINGGLKARTSIST